VYRVITDEQSQPQIDALPPDAVAPFAEARIVLEVAPWGGDSLNDDNPDRWLHSGRSGWPARSARWPNQLRCGTRAREPNGTGP
jgi:hypothetical protein